MNLTSRFLGSAAGAHLGLGSNGAIGAIGAIGALALACALAPRASAQQFDAQQLRLVPNQQDNYFSLHSARTTLGAGGWEGGLALNYANDSLVVVNSRGDRVASLIGDQLTANALFAFGVLDNVELGFDLPLVLVQSGDAPPAGVSVTGTNAGTGVGDLHAMAKWSLWNHDTHDSPGGTALALVVDVQVPTGEQSAFQGEGFRVEPRAVLDYAFPRSLRMSAQVGYLVRPKATLLGAEIDDTLTLGLGANLPLDTAQRWHAIGQVDAEVSVLASSIGAVEVPLETLFGARYYDPSGFMVQAGGGFGVNVGFGTPDYRVIAGVSYRPPHDPDPDGDGLLDDDDLCPSAPEDHDDFEDEDGCPDPDNDGDRIPDDADACRNEPEDHDGFQDQDGCPDPDNDGDGVPDAVDQCPNEPEDKDGFEDEDGCPDPDNDGDGHLDAEDGCPNEPEDRDGFEDEDGCADPDNDGDGVPDAKDACPNEAEDFDGFEDEDGCPEQGAGLVKLTCEKIDISERVYFDTGSDRIQERSFALLGQVADVLKAATYVKKLRVEGHTDDRGDDDYNLELSARRAASVVRFVVERGVPAERLVSEGFGETTPVASNASSAGRAKNRRVDFVVTEQDSRCAAR